MAMTSMPKITTEWQRFEALATDRLYELLRFRQSIFVVEQASPYPDLDGLDGEAWHLMLRGEGTLAGYLRLLPPADAEAPVRIGRVAVARALRHRGLGHKLVKEALRFCREHYSGLPVALTAQTYLVGFYRSFGFEPSGEPYDDFGVAHVAMARPGG
jgi:ElaA protein